MDIRKYFTKPATKINLNENSWIIVDTLPDHIYENNFETLWNLHPEEYGKIKIFNKIINCPRWTQVYMRPYYFSGMKHESLPLPDEFKPYLEWANSLNYGNFNIVLVNWYAHGSHYIGKHSDNEPEIIPNSPIISISLGATRTFRIRDKKKDIIIKDIEMHDKTVLIMGGEMQKHFTHEVPKNTKNEQRINITLRQML